MIKILPKQNQQIKPLTRNGNEYKPCVLGSCTGAIGAGLLVMKNVAKEDGFFAQKGAEIMKNVIEAKDLKQIIPAFAKNAGFGFVSGFAITAIVSLGAIIGHNLIDAPINQELRDQADGEAVRKALNE